MDTDNRKPARNRDWRYDHSKKGRERHQEYEKSEKAKARQFRYRDRVRRKQLRCPHPFAHIVDQADGRKKCLDCKYLFPLERTKAPIPFRRRG